MPQNQEMQGGLRGWSATGAVALLSWLSACGSPDSANATKPGKYCGKVVLDGGGGIVMPDDGSEAPECQPSACNFQSQTGCGSTQTCLPSVMDNAVVAGCFDPGTKELGESCKVANECVKSEACAGGQCRKLCCAGDWTVCDEGESCYRQFEYLLDDGPAATGAWVCYPVGTCSVLDPDACDSVGQDCKLVDSRGSEACMPKSPGELGEPCGAGDGRLCGRGLTCVGDAGSQTCRRLCRAEECGEPSCPVAEGACVHFDRDPAGVGECTPGW
jgi:hypothetical protein